MRWLWTWITRWFWWRTPVPDEAVRYTVRKLTQIAEHLDGGGEYKRHQVYSRLIKLYPEMSKRQLAWLIEDVLLEEERWSK